MSKLVSSPLIRKDRSCTGLFRAGHISEEDLLSSMLNLDPSLLKPFPSLPDPSSLFLTAPSEDEYDAITFLPLSGKYVKCNRCEWKTAALGGMVGVADGMVVRGWRRWSMDREGGCGCGGCWTGM